MHSLPAASQHYSALLECPTPLIQHARAPASKVFAMFRTPASTATRLQQDAHERSDHRTCACHSALVYAIFTAPPPLCKHVQERNGQHASTRHERSEHRTLSPSTRLLTTTLLHTAYCLPASGQHLPPPPTVPLALHTCLQLFRATSRHASLRQTCVYFLWLIPAAASRPSHHPTTTQLTAAPFIPASPRCETCLRRRRTPPPRPPVVTGPLPRREPRRQHRHQHPPTPQTRSPTSQRPRHARRRRPRHCPTTWIWH